MKELDNLISNNRKWAKNIKDDDPDFFYRLSKQQNPEYLWIGCSDSRVAANQIIDLPPGEVFVHRNIANVVSHSDLNCLSVIQYAVEVLKVKHIIVCGHYGCGGIQAAMDKQQYGLIDNWLQHINNVYRLNKEEVDGIDHQQDKLDRMCELNVIEQAGNVSKTTIVKNAWKANQDLTIHGWVYDIKDGILRNLNITVSG
jgi:carbonic anhydrase|tara:strand:- start:675 stop:1271 length:597 start_codon:yes stop_codon:yes gene_type:complete